ncbi:MAG: peptidylprolyl isomerase [Pseudomonadota bacterium]
MLKIAISVLLGGLALPWVSYAVESVKEAPAATQMAKPATEQPAVKKPPRVVMFKTNGVEVSVEDYVNFLQHNQMYVEKSMTKEGKAEVIRAIIGNQLLKDDLIRKGMVSKNATGQELGEAFKKLANEHFPLPPMPGEQAAYQYYLDHQNDYGIPEMVRISQIQFRTPENPTAEQKSAARQRAEAALRRLDAGEPFPKLAAELTENPSAKLPQGDIGFLPREGDPWLTEAVRNLKVGEHTKVIESPAGYEILMLTDVRKSLISPYANVRDKVMKSMMGEVQAKKRDAYVRELAKHAKIEIVQEELKPLFPKGVFP